jgi:hypothetical protein
VLDIDLMPINRGAAEASRHRLRCRIRQIACRSPKPSPWDRISHPHSTVPIKSDPNSILMSGYVERINSCIRVQDKQ